MTLEEAMTDLSIQLEVKRRLGQARQADAIRLGIEALKRLQINRKQTLIEWVTLLPGETEGDSND